MWRNLSAAERCLWEKNYPGALQQLGELASKIGVDLPSSGLPLRINVMALQAAYFSRDEALAEQCAVVAVAQINAKAHQRDGARIRYAGDYLVRVLEHCAGRFKSRTTAFLDLATSIEVAGRPYDLTKIPSTQKRKMPLPRLEN